MRVLTLDDLCSCFDCSVHLFYSLACLVLSQDHDNSTTSFFKAALIR
ncbi:hypothetical protein SynMVIR181_01139 [Synechococcus sp. MVIR-18-1]|nr:hypothetical protein SynMVIR181_01139 [Synechococcus sp. MVIR-18-1]